MGAGIGKSLGDAFRTFFNPQFIERAITVIAILAVGYLVIRFVLVLFRRISKKRLSPRVSSIVEKSVKYVGVLVILANAAKPAGFDLSTVLGAAGIAGIALGFAAQTSISNIISGLFLFSEKTFEIGDVLQIENMTGSVESVDLLSIKIRTFDNRLVRVPNESMIKSKIVNVTRWQERRLDLKLTLPLGVVPADVERLLRKAAMSVSAALIEPKPYFEFSGMDPAGMQFSFGVWFKKQDYYAFKTDLLYSVLAEFESAGLKPSLNFASMWDFPDSP